MSSTYGRGFKTAIKNGTSPWTWVEKTARKNNCTPNSIWKSLQKDGLCFNKKYGNFTFWFPTEFPKCSKTSCKGNQFAFFQFCIEYCLQMGWVTPEQCYRWSTAQLCYYCCNKCAQNFKKPAGFNPNKKVSPFPAGMTGTPTPNKTKKTTTTKKAKKTSPKRRKTTARKTTPKKTTGRRTTTAKKSTSRRPKLRLVGKTSTSRRRRTTTTRRRRAA